ncbi:MAG: RDD family protein [Acidimicrobiales bacterium]
MARAGLLDQNLLLRFTLFGNWYSIVWLVLYFSLGLSWGKGRTPGKWILGIRVVSLTHERLSFWHALERALGYGASALEAGIGQNRQTVHDRIAETIVVDERRPPARTTT